MKAEARRIIQVFLAIALAAAGIRVGVIYYERRTASLAEEAGVRQQQEAARNFNPDYYVVPKKLRAYDLKSARALVGGTVWVREGYRFTYFAYDPRARRVDFRHDAGLLDSLERLQIREVLLIPPPGPGEHQQVMAVFEKQGRQYAFSIGARHQGEYAIYADEMLFLQDPHQLYQHWSPDLWQAIERHEVKEGMNELQASFALGMGIPQRSADPSVKTVVYPHGGHKVVITFRDGKAAEIQRAGG